MSHSTESIRLNELRPRDAAIAYAKLGLAVVPLYKPRGGVCTCRKGKGCPSPGKHPRTRKGVSGATAEAKKLKRWKWETANVGIAAGLVSGIVVIDIDDEAAWKTLRDEYGPLPASPYVETPRPGFHLYYRHPGGYVPSRPLVTGVDVKGDGGYVVGPPSLHANGGRYVWANEPTHFPDLPVRWVEALSVTQKRKKHKKLKSSSDPSCVPLDIRSAIEAAILATMPTGLGQRQDCLFRFARRLRGLPELDGKPVVDVMEHVQAWYRLALPAIGTKDWLTTWADFVRAWGTVKYPEGADVMANVVERAIGGRTPGFVAKFGIDGDGPMLLVRLCRELQREAGEKPFFLSVRKAGEICDTDHMTAWRWLQALDGFGIIEMTKVGSNAGRKATEWRYLPSLNE